MTNEEKLEKLLKIKDKEWQILDQLKFNRKARYDKGFYQSLKYTIEIMKELDTLTKEYIDSMPNVHEIISTQDTIIGNEEEVEIDTNITGLHLSEIECDIIFNGLIPSDGYLTLRSKCSKGIRIYVKNNVPMSVYENYNRGYNFCDPTTVRYFEPGVYQINKNTVVGIIIEGSIIRGKVKQYLDERAKRVNM